MSGLNIVVVEDHDASRDATVAALCNMGHAARGVDCAEALDDEASTPRADLLIIELNLPGEDGLSLARRMRAAEPELGIIILTACNRLADKVASYEGGADLYLTKPIAPEELGAAIHALSRRIRPPAAWHLTLNPATLQLTGSLWTLDVSGLECALLQAFMDASENRLNTLQMLEISARPGEPCSKSALEVQIVRLRKKLEQAGAATPTIKSIRGVGYQLCIRLEIKKTHPGPL